MASSEYTRLRSDDNQRPHSYGTSDPEVGFVPRNSVTEFFQRCEKITTCLFTVNNSTTSLDRMLKQVGTGSDNQQLRDRITQVNSIAGKAVQDTTDLLRELQPLARGDKERRVRADRLKTEFEATATRFSEVQKKMMVTMRTARLPADMVAVEQDASASSEELIRREQMLQAKKKEIQDLEFETAMQLEREQRVHQLESDIIDINEIMRDLSAMVHTQGEMVALYRFYRAKCGNCTWSCRRRTSRTCKSSSISEQESSEIMLLHFTSGSRLDNNRYNSCCQICFKMN
ncbi:syntaxin-7-like isoform X1 [Macrobrachium rosenbergii]|uniref:syntaxin-7-like isoform X1 n=1 Tax=Macrobrachium rosenbergii TaxID=79674 RepID=UPI0034D66C1A